MLFEPRGAQIEALCALENTRAEGARRALVQAATGVGKTYLAAFDSKKYDRVLFVAHREEILKQAAESFKPHMRKWADEATKAAVWEVYKFIHVNTVAPFGTFRTKIRKWKKIVL